MEVLPARKVSEMYSQWLVDDGKPDDLCPLLSSPELLAVVVNNPNETESKCISCKLINSAAGRRSAAFGKELSGVTMKNGRSLQNHGRYHRLRYFKCKERINRRAVGQLLQSHTISYPLCYLSTNSKVDSSQSVQVGGRVSGGGTRFEIC
jgi:hypothetical protein